MVGLFRPPRVASLTYSTFHPRSLKPSNFIFGHSNELNAYFAMININYLILCETS